MIAFDLASFAVGYAIGLGIVILFATLAYGIYIAHHVHFGWGPWERYLRWFWNRKDMNGRLK